MVTTNKTGKKVYTRNARVNRKNIALLVEISKVAKNFNFYIKICINFWCMIDNLIESSKCSELEDALLVV